MNTPNRNRPNQDGVSRNDKPGFDNDERNGSSTEIKSQGGVKVNSTHSRNSKGRNGGRGFGKRNNSKGGRGSGNFSSRPNTEGLIPNNSASLPDIISADSWILQSPKTGFPEDSEGHLSAECSIEFVQMHITGAPNSIVHDEFDLIFGEWERSLEVCNYNSNFVGLGNKSSRKVDRSKLREYFVKVTNFYAVYSIFSQLFYYERMYGPNVPPAIQLYCANTIAQIGSPRKVLVQLKSNVGKLYIPPTIISYIDDLFGFKVTDSQRTGVLHQIKGIQIFITETQVDDDNLLDDPGKILNFPPQNDTDVKLFQQYYKRFINEWIPEDDGAYDSVSTMLQIVKPSWSLKSIDLQYSDIPVMKQWVYDTYHNLPVPSKPYLVRESDGKYITLKHSMDTNYEVPDGYPFTLMFNKETQKNLQSLIFSNRTELVDGFELNEQQNIKYDTGFKFKRPSPGIITRLPNSVIGDLKESPIRYVLNKYGNILPLIEAQHKMSQGYRFEIENGISINVSSEQRYAYTYPYDNALNDLNEMMKFIIGHKEFINSDYFTIQRNSQ